MTYACERAIFKGFLLHRSSCRLLVFVVVIAVGGVTVAVVDVVGVVAVGHCDMATAPAMGVLVGRVCGVLIRFALVVVRVVRAVQMAVVDVVDVIGMGDGDVAAALAMGVAVLGVFGMRVRHDVSASWMGIFLVSVTADAERFGAIRLSCANGVTKSAAGSTQAGDITRCRQTQNSAESTADQVSSCAMRTVSVGEQIDTSCRRRSPSRAALPKRAQDLPPGGGAVSRLRSICDVRPDRGETVKRVHLCGAEQVEVCCDERRWERENGIFNRGAVSFRARRPREARRVTRSGPLGEMAEAGVWGMSGVGGAGAELWCSGRAVFSLFVGFWGSVDRVDLGGCDLGDVGVGLGWCVCAGYPDPGVGGVVLHRA